ncbi:hypothetical protein ACIQMJ_28615 [Actinosynnema sp. NPDC091369]
MPATAVVQRRSPEPGHGPADNVVQRKSGTGPSLGEPLAAIPTGAVVQRNAVTEPSAPPPPSPLPSPDQVRLPVVALTRPPVQRHTATAPLITQRPLVFPTTTGPTPATPRTVPVRWSSAAHESRAHVQRAVARPTPPVDLPEVAPDRPIAPAYPPVVVAPPKPVPRAPAAPQATTRPTTVQRARNQPAKAKQRKNADQPKPPPPDRADLDDLARRLLEPVGRLLRAELRQGRERAGLLHDRRR